MDFSETDVSMVKGKVIEAANESEIALFRTSLNQFETSVLLDKILKENS